MQTIKKHNSTNINTNIILNAPRKPTRKPRVNNKTRLSANNIPEKLNTDLPDFVDQCTAEMYDDDGVTVMKDDMSSELCGLRIVLLMISPYLMFRGVKTDDRILVSISVFCMVYVISNMSYSIHGNYL